MPCPYWICGLESPAMVVGHIRKRSPGKIFLTTGEPHASKGLVLKISKTVKVENDDYGLVIVSCAGTVKAEDKKELINLSRSIDSKSRKILDSKLKKIIDLSQLEVIAFFSFIDPSDPNARMSSEIGLWHYKNLFKNFINKNDSGRRLELYGQYIEHQQSQGSPKSPRIERGSDGPNPPSPPTW